MMRSDSRPGPGPRAIPIVIAGAAVLVFLVQAHRGVVQLNRLIGRLSNDDSVVYVTLDRKSAIRPDEIDSRARLVGKRIDVLWGSWSLVEAALNALREIEDAGFAYRHVVYLSGEDYPVVDMAGFREALREGVDYLSFVPVSDEGWPCEERFTRFHGGSRGVRPFLRAANAVGGRIGYRRRMPAGMVPCAGSNWWNLTQPTIRSVLAFVERNPGVVRFFKRTACPDELFFQTIVKHLALDTALVNDNLRYIRFPEGGSHPDVLDMSHAARILASNAILIRKVQDPVSIPLLRHIAAVRNLPAVEP